MRNTCQSPAELERAYFEGREELEAHAESCPSCRRSLREISMLVEHGRSIEPSESRRHEEIRTILLAAEELPAKSGPLQLRWPVVAGAALAIAAAAALLLWPGRSGDGTQPTARATVVEHPGAHMMYVSQHPDEVIRLTEGTISVDVEHLRAGERVRVVTGDAEVEVRGTLFEVSAAQDVLQGVRVIRGLVEVRRDGVSSLLREGESWTVPPRVPDAPVEPRNQAPGADAGQRENGQRRNAPVEPVRAEPPRIRIDSGIAPAAGSASEATDPREAALELGLIAVRGARYDEAARAFERALAEPGNRASGDDARYWRAVALARAKSVAAIAAFEEFLHRSPLDARAGEASVMLGWLLLEDGQLDGAEKRFRSALKDRAERVRASAADGLEALHRKRSKK